MSRVHAIVVGFGPGNGVGIAKAFAKAGFDLSLLSRNPEKQRDAMLALAQSGVSAEPFKADAADPVSLTNAVKSATARFGVPEVLIYNVAVPAMGKPSSVNPTKLTADFSTNVAGALVAANAVLPQMLARRSGTILFTGGAWALYPSADFTSLSVSKAALRALVFTLADELKGTGVRAGTVTIFGAVEVGTAFDPEKIGNAFVELFKQPTESFPVELQFTGTKAGNLSEGKGV